MQLKVSTTIYLKKEQMDALATLSASTKIPKSEYIRTAINEFLTKTTKNISGIQFSLNNQISIIGNITSRHSVGKEPMDAKLEKNLTRRGYKILHFGDLPNADLQRLLDVRKIGLPEQGEWLAFRSWWKRTK